MTFAMNKRLNKTHERKYETGKRGEVDENESVEVKWERQSDLTGRENTENKKRN